MGRQGRFWDLEDYYAKLSEMGNPLEPLAVAVNFKPFTCKHNLRINH